MFSTMASQRLPERLTLEELPLSKNGFRPGKYQRGIQVEVTDRDLEQMIQSIREANGAHVSLGKKPAIFIGDHQVLPIKPLVREKSFVYTRQSGEKRARLHGALSLKDANARAKTSGSQDLDLNDPALLSLQQSLAEHAQKKQASTTLLVKDSRQLPPEKSGRAALKAAKSNKLLKPHRQGMFDQSKVVRSMPSSPSLSGMTPMAPSKPTAKDLRHDALKNSLIHLLAVRAVSEQYIAKTLRCEPSDLKDLLEKYGRPSRLDSRKFDLSDRGYKELDVWEFNYKDTGDRQAAIDRAITAFDRQRISVRESVWQLLLPKDERGKGKVLSKLNLHSGTMDRVKTPQIHVQSTSDNLTNGKVTSGDERPGRLAPSSAAVRSSSQEPPNKPKVSEKEAQAKRLLSKAKNNNTTSTTTNAVKKASPKPETKKPAAKRGGASNSKYKSAEFVVDSSDDSDMEDEPIKVAASSPPASKPKAPVKPVSKSSPPAATEPRSKPAVSKPTTTNNKGASAANSTSLKPRPADYATTNGKPIERKRKNSSPLKPSRLGSSPPTNASDMDRDRGGKSSNSSSSSSPLINQRRNTIGLDMSKIKPASRHSASNSSSDRAPKRKANELSSSSRDPTGSAREGDRPVKRRPLSPRHSSTSDAVDNPLSSENLQSARRFKEMQSRYANMLRKVRAQSNPSRAHVEKLQSMYSKLAAHKKDLTRLVVT